MFALALRLADPCRKANQANLNRGDSLSFARLAHNILANASTPILQMQ